ncbi:glycosyltransferase family 2 protein [Candidatus Roizmanbacteria bacterium]|nr:MAG: glycosyltransferase family 2 protein [Candidatus Roizmanbacteria bacterium]
MNISVIIPTYRNTEVLLKNLKHNLPYLDGCEIIVVNDYPKQTIKKDLNQFAQIRVIENMTNKGFAGTVNTGVREATRDYILLLNDDVKLLNSSYKKAFDQLQEDKTLFAVSFAQKETNGSIVGKNMIYWKNGFLQHQAVKPDTAGPNAWAEGGSCLVDKKKFDELHGFDEMFNPFYWEDIDLSYRAWKKGYRIEFNPQILVEHHHETTISSHFQKDRIEAIAYRNQLLFTWKNISSWDLLIAHKLHLIKRLVSAIMKNDVNFLEGFIQALKRFPQAFIKHFRNPKLRSDHELLKTFTQ